MGLAGLTLPRLSMYHPATGGEGSLDPMGLAALSDRIADHLAPAVRSRMLRFRFVTASAVGAMACDGLEDVIATDGVSTYALAFEWLTIEAFARRIPAHELPAGVPGSRKARVVLANNQRLSAATYLKMPTVFGFVGVYKPFAIDAGILTQSLGPGPRASELVKAWEADQGRSGFVDSSPGSDGERLRHAIELQVRQALQTGRCTTSNHSPVFRALAESLRPDKAGPRERDALRHFILDERYPVRAELARHLGDVDADAGEAEMLSIIRPRASASLRSIIDAVIAYERLAISLDALFRTLIVASYAAGARPVTGKDVRRDTRVTTCARELPSLFADAAEAIRPLGLEVELESKLGAFSSPLGPEALAELALTHHEEVQAAKPPTGKQPWFERLPAGWVIRKPYANREAPKLDGSFVHPVRVAAVRRFLEDARS